MFFQQLTITIKLIEQKQFDFMNRNGDFKQETKMDFKAISQVIPNKFTATTELQYSINGISSIYR